jgi:hypothetical protein
MIQDWRDVLPAQSVVLTVPVVLADEYDDKIARRFRERAKRVRSKHGAEPENDSGGG